MINIKWQKLKMAFGVCGAMYTEDICGELWSCNKTDIYVSKFHVNIVFSESPCALRLRYVDLVVSLNSLSRRQ